MLLQTLAPLPHIISRAAAAPADVPTWLAGHLCLADAFVPGKAPADEAPAKKLPLCPICLGLQLAHAYAPPDAARLTPPSEADGIRFADWHPGEPSTAHRTLAQARAPPLTA